MNTNTNIRIISVNIIRNRDISAMTCLSVNIIRNRDISLKIALNDTAEMSAQRTETSAGCLSIMESLFQNPLRLGGE